MRRWTLLSRAERGGVILSGAWTTSTCYKPREIERPKLRPALIMVSASLLPLLSPTPVLTCSLAIEVPDARIWVYPQRVARYSCPRRCSSPRSPRLSRAPRRMVSAAKEPTMALGTISLHGYVHEDERPCSHVPPARPSWRHRLWRQLRTHSPVAFSTVSALQEERRRARSRSPCAIDG